ncbi:MAG: enoyl-CoA hydratase [Solirubrobacterales bacterium]|nr:enoyl-CoA hydratase [Solirubrobacterales bacterium]
MWTEQRIGRVAVARYENPPVSYFTDAAVDELDEMLDAWAHAEDLGAVVLSGRDGRFITHFDVEAILRSQVAPDPLVDAPTRSRRVQSVLRRLTMLPQPVIAALGGDAMGFGFELALACDLRIGQRGDHRYGLPEVRLGIIPGGSGTTRLTKLLGAPRALDLILRARVLSPEEALAQGLVHELADDAESRAGTIARRIAELPPVAVAMAKQVIHRADDLPLEAALAFELEGSFRSKQAPEAAEAMRAYLDVPLSERRAWLDAERAENRRADLEGG